jgi:hypothetical protein
MTLRPAVFGAAFIVAVMWPTASSAAQGLQGAYYLPSSRGYHIDDEGLPVTTKEPDATRIDAQIAFGAGKGFVRGAGKQLVWWTPERDTQVAAIWKGYVRLPKAGTYYFTTVSDDASAVYLNKSRVALNGELGYYIVSEAFRYPDANPAPHPSRLAYVVPVPVDGPRVLPIEVRYVAYNASSTHGFGIDLYWVTPDAKRDDAGKPIAELVPAAALITETPEPITPARVSRTHSTISSDFLYFPDDGTATLSVRLADERGRPVAGRRVHISSLTSYGRPDAITQPAKPTDENGVATATVQAQRAKHVSTFFATDITEFVDVGQTVEMTMSPQKLAFLPPAFSPYYDGKHFKVSPSPPRAGQPTTVSVPLTNRQKTPFELTVRLLKNPQNIGLRDWTKIAESQTFTVKPEETKLVDLTWTPTEESSHLCFKVEVWGTMKRAGTGPPWLPVNVAIAASPPRKDDAGRQLLESRQQNIGPVKTTCEPNAKKRCDSISNARNTVNKMIKSHMSSSPDAKSLTSWKGELEAQLKGTRELLCDSSVAQNKVDEMRQRLISFNPGQATFRPDVVAQGRNLSSIELDLEQLNKKLCTAPTPPPKKPPAVVVKDDPCLRETKDLLKPKNALEFLWWWISEVFAPDPAPPGFDLLDPCLAPQAMGGWLELQKERKARDALENGRDNEYERIRRMSMEEFLKEYGQ